LSSDFFEGQTLTQSWRSEAAAHRVSQHGLIVGRSESEALRQQALALLRLIFTDDMKVSGPGLQARRERLTAEIDV